MDLDCSELERTLAAVPDGTFKHVRCFGLLGTYDDGLDWLNTPQIKPRPKTILSMGSSIGNFPRDAAVKFVNGFASVLSPVDTMIIGLDACQDPGKVHAAYNDRDGVTHNFTLNGLKHANRLLGSEAFDMGKWEAVGKYDVPGGRHQAFVSPRLDVEVLGVRIRKGELIRIEESYKYSPAQASELWRIAGVVDGAQWFNRAGDYGKLDRWRVVRISSPC